MNGERYANPNALVSADWLSGHLDDPDVRVVEVDVSPKSYGEGHIPGAAFWDIYKMLKDPQYRLVDAKTVEQIVRDSGIGPNTKVVFYGYGPALGYWLMELYRHANVSILNLSKQRWHEQGRPWTTEPSEFAPTTYSLAPPDARLRALQPEVEAIIGARDAALVDTRSEAEYRGERFWPSGAPAPNGRAGRVPGATHVPLDAVVDADGTYVSPDALRKVFPASLAGVPELVTYCTIGNRASIGWFVLSELLGQEGVRVYDGSWAEWGLNPQTPVESEAVPAP